MNDQLPMFGPMTCEDSGSVTGSPESESGVTLYGSPDGPMTGKSGPDHAPASPSAPPAKEKRSTTKGIFGQSGFFSSANDDLSYALASRLRRLTDSLGSTLFTLTWITRVTPAGLSISALRASDRPNGDSVCIGWPTPNTPSGGPNTESTLKHTGGMDLDGAVMLAGWATATARDHKDHAETDAVPINAFLGCQVWLAGWPSPVVGDGWNPDTPESIQHEIDHHNLRGMVHLASWLTPKVKTGAYQYANGNHETPVLNLEGMAELAGWPTPMAGTPATGDYNEAGNSDYSRRVVELVRLTDSGAGPIGFLLGPNGWGDPPGLRPVESGTFPLVNGDTARLGRLRGYGDAIVAPQAATFIEAVMETIDGCC